MANLKNGPRMTISGVMKAVFTFDPRDPQQLAFGM